MDDTWSKAGGRYQAPLEFDGDAQCEFRIFTYKDGSPYHRVGSSNRLQLSRSLAAASEEVLMTASPSALAAGEKATLAWKGAGSYKPESNDWIGFYCGGNLTEVDDDAYMDWAYVTVDSGYASGAGNETLAIKSARKPWCEFRMFNHEDGSSYFRIGRSNAIRVTDAASHVEHLHLALTGDPAEMLVQWTAGMSGGFVEFAPKGAPWESASRATASCHTYAAKDMCHAPATSWWYFTDPGQLCEALMKGLTPDQEYQYRVSANGGESYSATSVFRAAPEVHPEYNFTYLVYGDMGTHGGDTAQATARLCARDVADGARMTHHFGDLSYARGTAHVWDVWMGMIEPYARVTPYMVGIGNHEFDYTSGGGNDPSGQPHFQPSWFNGGSDSGGECGVPTVNRFHMPGSSSGGNGLFWYSYDFGSLHTVMLSSEHDLGEGSAQYEWLAKDLARVDRSRTPWLVVELHRPMYNSEAYAGDYKVAENFQRLFEELLVQHDVDLVLAGHYHSYLRSKRIYKDKADDARGIYHFTIGSAGFPLDGAGLYDKDWVEHFDEDYGYGRITIANSTAMLWEYIRNKDNPNDRTVVDRAWILKRRAHPVYF